LIQSFVVLVGDSDPFGVEDVGHLLDHETAVGQHFHIGSSSTMLGKPCFLK